MKKFQIDFTKVPKFLQETVREKVTEVFRKTKHGNSDLFKQRRECDYFVVNQCGDKAITYTNNGPFQPGEHEVCDVLNDWDKWNYYLAKTFDSITVKVNNEYSAIVNEKCILVGCQTVQFDVVDKLADAVKKAREFKP